MGADGKYDHDKSESLDRLFKMAVEKIDAWEPEDEDDNTTIEFEDGCGYDVSIEVSVKNYRKEPEYMDGHRIDYVEYDIEIGTTAAGFLVEEDEDMGEWLYQMLIKKYK